jgi:hypothetical protein
MSVPGLRPTDGILQEALNMRPVRELIEVAKRAKAQRTLLPQQEYFVKVMS